MTLSHLFPRNVESTSLIENSVPGERGPSITHASHSLWLGCIPVPNFLANMFRDNGASHNSTSAVTDSLEPEVPSRSESSTGSTRPLAASSLSAKDSPIRVLSHEEAEAAAAKLRANLKSGWRPNHMLDSDASSEEQAWNDRLGQTMFVLSSMTKRAELMVGCFFDGEPIGLAGLEMPQRDDPNFSKGLKVLDIVTHPGGAGAGGALIERAADVSHAWGLEGKLQLVALGSAAKAAYAALGFVHDGKLMTLTPSSSQNQDIWALKDGEWRLNKYLTKELASGVNDLARQE